MNTSRAWVSVCVLVGLLAGTAVAVNIETVPVGNPGNAGEFSGTRCRAATALIASAGGGLHVQHRQVRGDGRAVHGVPQRRGQDRHLRAVQHVHGSSQPLYGCKIKRSGSSGSYTYSVAADWANRPVNYVSWGDCGAVCQLASQRPADGAQGLRPPRTGRTTSTGRRANAALLAVTRKANCEVGDHQRG